jgi:dipeptidyl aminopeptidase/acylaminoacyl peptidase
MPFSRGFVAAGALLLLGGWVETVAAAQPRSAPDPAAARRPMTHEDLWLMPRVSAPVPSPDGRWVVFSVTESAYDAKDVKTDLWIVPADGSAAARRLTTVKGAETGADWSPDSSRIVFSAKRGDDEVNQLYVLNLADGGEAERITSLSTGARTPKWSPDGSRVLFTSEVYPGAADDAANQQAAKARKERKWNARVYDGFPIRYWDRWLDEKQVHLFVQEARDGAVPRNVLAGSELVRQPGFGGRRQDTGSESLSAIWAPDGRSLVFAASVDRHQAAFAEVTYALYAVSADGGEPHRLTPPGHSYNHPVFSRNGRTLAAVSSADGTGKVHTLNRLTVWPWPLGTADGRVVTAGFDRSVEKPVFSADGDRIYFCAEDTGLMKLFSVRTSGGDVQPEPGPSTGTVNELAAGGAGGGFHLFSLWQNASQPPEIHRLAPGAHAWQRLTHLTAERTALLDLPPIESFTFTSRGGRPIQNFLVRPAAFDPMRRYPVIAIIHGGPHTMFRDQWVLRWNYHLLAGTEYVLVLTNYSGSTGFGEAFAQHIQGDPLRTPADEINEAVEVAVARYDFVDGSRRAAAGASYGGHLANWLQATTTHYRCLISHAGLVNLESQWATSDVIYLREINQGGPVWEQGEVWRTQNPQRLAGAAADGTGWVTPMLITVGEQDFRVPLNNSLENWSLHQRLQIPSRLIVFPDEHHWILKGENSRFWYGEVRAWWAKWLQ